MSVPLPDPMTSVIQKKNGVKRKVTPTAKKPKMLAAPQFRKVTNAEIDSCNAEVANDLAATNVLNEPKIKKDPVEKPSSYVRIIAKPKQLSLDPKELQSITNLQNWCPSIRNPVNEGKTGNKTTKTFTSQKEGSDDSKSVLPIVKLTQYNPVVWNPPIRRTISATETSATPAKRAKISETDKSDLKSKDKRKEMLESTLEYEKNNRKTLNQLEDHAVSNDALKPTNITINFLVENLESLNEQEEISQQLAKSCIKIFSPEKLETYDNFISYSPIEVDKDQQALIEENLPKRILVGDSKVASSPNSEEDMFLSQEPSEDTLLSAESQNQNSPKNMLACKKEETRRENLNAVLNNINVKPNSINGIFPKIYPSQESSDKDMFEAENQSEDNFDVNWIREVAKLKTTSQRSSGEGVFVEKIEDDKEATEKDMFHSEEEIIPLINVGISHCESQHSKSGCILSPPINGVGVIAESDLLTRTPPRQFELDIFSCQTVKRVCLENPITLPSLLMDNQLPEIYEEVCATRDNNVGTVCTENLIRSLSMDNHLPEIPEEICAAIARDTAALTGCTENEMKLPSLRMDNQLPEIPEEVCVESDTTAVGVVQVKEIHPHSISNEVNAIAKTISQDESVIASSVNDTVYLEHVTKALELTNDVEMAVVNVGASDVNVSKCAFEEDQHAKSHQFTIISVKKDFVDLCVQNETKNIPDKTVVQEDEINAFHLAEGKKTMAEEQLQLDVDNNLTKVDFKNDDNSIVVDRIDLLKKVDISSANEKRKTEFVKFIKPNTFSQNEMMRDDINSEIQGSCLIAKLKIPPEAKIGSPKLNANEKAMLEGFYTREVILSPKKNSDCKRNSEMQSLQIDRKDKTFQAAQIESKNSIENERVLTEVDSLRSNAKDDDEQTVIKEQQNKVKPYTYEMEQDFDISQSQLIEIESAIMRESRHPGPTGRCVSAKGISRVVGGFPRVAETAPGVVSGTCGEARTPGFSMPSLPPMPTLNWKKKVQDDRQKLRAVIHEISRLNAMLMSVRREVWPVAGVNPEAPPLSDINRQGPGPVGRRY